MKNCKLKYILISTLLLFCNFIVAQNKNIELKGTIVDETGEVLPYVAVTLVKKNIGTATTEDGEFSLYVSKNELKDSLSISSLGFDPLKLKVEDFLKLKSKKITLIAVATTLDEIVLLKTDAYVINAIKKLKENTISTPYQMDVLFRRATTEGNVPKFFIENYIKVRMLFSNIP